MFGIKQRSGGASAVVTMGAEGGSSCLGGRRPNPLALLKPPVGLLLDGALFGEPVSAADSDNTCNDK